MKSTTQYTIRTMLRDGLGVEDIAVRLLQRRGRPLSEVRAGSKHIAIYVRGYVQELRNSGWLDSLYEAQRRQRHA